MCAHTPRTCRLERREKSVQRHEAEDGGAAMKMLRTNKDGEEQNENIRAEGGPARQETRTRDPDRYLDQRGHQPGEE